MWRLFVARDDTAGFSPASARDPPLPTTTVSGTVFEYTADGRQPAAGVILSVLSENLMVIATSDADGRYSASAQGSFVSIAPAVTQACMSPCPSGTGYLTINPNRTIDVAIVSSRTMR